MPDPVIVEGAILTCFDFLLGLSVLRMCLGLGVRIEVEGGDRLCMAAVAAFSFVLAVELRVLYRLIVDLKFSCRLFR